ncbi:MAG: hypothetical protein ACKN9T_09120 [Candidatus Methylumidiphilus sp.]
MPWQIKFHADLGIVETVYSGLISPAELQAVARATLDFGLEHASDLYLGDCGNLQGGHSIFDLYAIVDLLEACGFSRLAKEAILFPQLAAVARDAEFWETSTKNRGFNVRLFRDRASAIRWLLEP